MYGEVPCGCLRPETFLECKSDHVTPDQTQGFKIEPRPHSMALEPSRPAPVHTVRVTYLRFHHQVASDTPAGNAGAAFLLPPTASLSHRLLPYRWKEHFLLDALPDCRSPGDSAPCLHYNSFKLPSPLPACASLFVCMPPQSTQSKCSLPKVTPSPLTTPHTHLLILLEETELLDSTEAKL